MTLNPTHAPTGLATAEAQRRLRQHGPNEIDASERRGWAASLRAIASEPMFVLLLVAAAVYLVVGDLAEGLLLATFAALTVGLVVLQERRSERALDALRALAAPLVRVLRDGRMQRVAASELVPGDVFLAGEGERLPADARLCEGSALSVDESLLTGESVPVPKMPGAETGRLFAGTLVTSGHGVAEVTQTGGDTRAGGIGLSLAAITRAPTPLQAQLRKLVAWLGAGAIALSVLLAVGYGLVHGDWLQGALSGIAAAMSMLPEEFPMALSVFFSLGAWRLAQVKVLARRPAAIEALGAATILCVDKTGTLTENRMRLRRLATQLLDVDVAHDAQLPREVHVLLEFAALASRRDGVEPMDRAIHTIADLALADTGGLHPAWKLEREFPVTPQLLATCQVWITGAGDRVVAAKGAPEAVMALCHVDPAQAAALAAQVEAFAREGLRVLGVACAYPQAAEAATHAHHYEFRWLGLAAFEDPLREGVPQAVAQAHGAGIGVAMVTGDHAVTALAIARQAGIDTRAGVLTGTQLEAMGDHELASAVRRVRVFARVQPEQKLRLVQALRANGEVVAMTGDGVNDAPALKAAHIGIAMGARGTDVAREAAGLVLLDDDFGHIVAAVRMGRRIQDNLRRVMAYITAIHVPIVGLSLLPLGLGLPPLMLPAHVVLTEMIIDPVCSLAFEGAPERPGTMERPPRPPAEPLIGWPTLRRGLLQGACVLAASLGVYAAALPATSVESARAQALVALTAGNLGLVWLNASSGAGWRAVFDEGYGAFRVVAVVACALLAAALAFEPSRALLRVDLPAAGELAWALACAAAGVGFAALLANLRRRGPEAAAATGP